MAITKFSGSSINPADMRSNVQFQANTPSSDGSGGQIDSYATFYTCRGRFLKQSGRRSLENMELVRNQTFELVVRYTTQIVIDQSTQLIIDGSVYIIQDYEAKVDGRPHWSRFIVCLKVNA